MPDEDSIPRPRPRPTPEHLEQNKKMLEEIEKVLTDMVSLAKAGAEIDDEQYAEFCKEYHSLAKQNEKWIQEDLARTALANAAKEKEAETNGG